MLQPNVNKLYPKVNPTHKNNNMKTKIRLVGKNEVEADSVILLKADANYTEVHLTNGSVIVVSKTLKQMAKTFSTYSFFRIHKSFLVNMNRVESIQLNDGARAKLSNNTYAQISRRRKDAFIDAMKSYI